jgi:hypothetical protein
MRLFAGDFLPKTREICLRYLSKPALNRWIAEALTRMSDKIRADIRVVNSRCRTLKVSMTSRLPVVPAIRQPKL